MLANVLFFFFNVAFKVIGKMLPEAEKIISCSCERSSVQQLACNLSNELKHETDSITV